jgi:hypothetical protein
MLVSGVGTISSPHSGNGAYVARSVLRAMALIVLATICFLGCVFLVFVLVQWMQDTKRKTATRPVADSKVSETREEKRPHMVGSGRTLERRDRFRVGANRVSTIRERWGGRESGYDERERIAYERIARAWRSGKRA